MALGLVQAWDFFTKPQGPNPSLSFGRELLGLACGTAGSVAACWLGLAGLGAGPLPITVPLAIGLLLAAMVAHTRAVPGGNLHPAGRFAVTAGLAFLLVGGASVLITAV